MICKIYTVITLESDANVAGGAAANPALWPSLSLDEDNCVVHYTGSLDKSTFGVKPIAIMMEDFDALGNVRSSIPVQFLAQVWTPSLDRYVGYPKWFDEDNHHDDDHEEHQSVSRGRRSAPAYCTAKPFFIGTTPADGDELDASGGQLSFSLQAESQVGTISFFTYQAPLGLTCTTVDITGTITCSWTPSSDQLEIENHQFCFDATDSQGLLTERRCITIKTVEETTTTTSTTTSTTTTSTTTTTTTTTPRPLIRNIFDCAFAVLDRNSTSSFFRSTDVIDYGCAGRGNFDAFAVTAGKQLDDADHAFYAWKKCYQCATGGDPNLVSDYDYDLETDSCGTNLIFE